MLWFFLLLYDKAKADFSLFLYDLFFYLDLYLLFTLFFVFFLMFFWLTLFMIMYFEVYNWIEDQLNIIKIRVKINNINKKINYIKTDDYLKVPPKKSNFFSIETSFYVKYLILKKKIKKIWKRYV